MKGGRVGLMVVLLALGVACDGTVENPVNESVGRIVGGSNFSGFPAVGALAYNGSQHCTGTLISPNKVVTAGHCVAGVSASRMQFVIGPSLNQAEHVLSVASVQAHPDYDAYNIRNDIGLVTLASSAPVEPMPVVEQIDSSWVGESLFFVGYGVDDGYSQTGAGVKRAVWIAVTQVYATAFRYEHPDKNTCNGDSGGPAFVKDPQGNYLLAGVTSYGDAYCSSYGVDTRVDVFRDFLGLGSGGSGGGTDGCGDETYVGRCDGDTVVWCQDDQVHNQDCAAEGKACAFDDARGYYACIDGGSADDPCNGETYLGRCDGDTVVWCQDDQVQSQDCAAEGKVCVFDDAKQYYACREPASVDPCNGETFEGRCEDGSVIWCEDNEVKSIDCTTNGADCGYNQAKGYYDCL